MLSDLTNGKVGVYEKKFYAMLKHMDRTNSF